MKIVVFLLLSVFTFITKISAQTNLPLVVPPFSVNVNGVHDNNYLFFSGIDMTLPTSNWPSTVMILDKEGDLLFYLPFANETEAPYTRKAVGNFQIHDDGRMSFTDALFGPGSIYIMDSTFQITDTVTCSPQYVLDGHDFVITPDGHYHLLAMEERIMDASALTTESGQTGDPNCVVIGHIIQEFDQNNVLVGEWKSLDHFALSDIYPYYFTDSLRVDHAHVNSLFVDDDGNYVISSRSLNEITRINYQTGQIMWRLGGKNNEFTFLNDTIQFTAQHDAQYFSNGQVVLFDNATFTTPHAVARMLIYDLDDVNMTVNPVLSYYHPLNFYSGFMGSGRSLGNDNFLISWGGGFDYALGSSIQEFDLGLNEVMEVDLVDGFASYRAIKSDIPWEINRPIITCNQNTMELSTLNAHPSYYWSTGDTTASITITSPGKYQVWITAGDGFLSSESFEVTDLNSLCTGTSASNNPYFSKLSVYPIPAQDILNLQWEQPLTENIAVEMVDMMGRTVYQADVNRSEILKTINVSAITSGVYVLKVIDLESRSIISKRISIGF
ncbi:MAG: aryl-sulfate sulfotransferase [Vicingaceae bacterium]|nr:aryl-sulfate sulfotransferase [Vicingaceae bacterium]